MPSQTATMQESDLLLVIDPQLDFCATGRLAVADGDAVMPLINQLAFRFEHIILTQDWHPAGHSSFASAHPGRQPFETIQAVYGPQTLWPDPDASTGPVKAGNTLCGSNWPATLFAVARFDCHSVSSRGR